MIKFQPAPSYFLIEEDAPETKTAGGLHIPEMVQAAPKNTGKIVAVPPFMITDSVIYEQNSWVVGERILFSFHAGTKVVIDEKPYRLLHWKEILGSFDFRMWASFDEHGNFVEAHSERFPDEAPSTQAELPF